MSDLINDMRALLAQFERAGLRDFYVRTGDWSAFLARSDGAANPMLAAAEAAAPAPTPAPAPVTTTMIAAPHLGLFQPQCRVGDDIAAGALIATIDVLGRATEVRAEAAGRVAHVHGAANDLVEYGARLIDLDVAA